jgi:deoxyribodipyrimidine photo-lyase
MASIQAKINAVRPAEYAQTRNFCWGAVTELSPYLSRGLIQLPALAAHAKWTAHANASTLKFLQELGWREYWQRCWQAKGDAILQDLKQPQSGVRHEAIPTAIMRGQTGIEAVDAQIETLKETGYMHNHARMYTASIACNVAQSHWLNPAMWMYYHLLDGDLASNLLSWQWVAGSNASKKYWCNQENINRYFGTQQRGTFLDRSYEQLPTEPVPSVLMDTQLFSGYTHLPHTMQPKINPHLPTLVYNSYQLDPAWLSDLEANRILLLEPEHFKRFPIGEKVLSFILSLAQQIPQIQIFTASFEELKKLTSSSPIHFKEHPTTRHYQGIQHERSWLAPDIQGYFPSFFAWWKKAEKSIFKIPATPLLLP